MVLGDPFLPLTYELAVLLLAHHAADSLLVLTQQATVPLQLPRGLPDPPVAFENFVDVLSVVVGNAKLLGCLVDRDALVLDHVDQLKAGLVTHAGVLALLLPLLLGRLTSLLV